MSHFRVRKVLLERGHSRSLTWCGLCPTGQVKRFQEAMHPETSTVRPSQEQCVDPRAAAQGRSPLAAWPCVTSHPLPPAPGRRVHTHRHAPAVLVTSNSSFFRGTSLSLSNAALDYEGKSRGCPSGQVPGRSAAVCSPGRTGAGGSRSTPGAGCVRTCAFAANPRRAALDSRPWSNHGSLPNVIFKIQNCVPLQST